MLYKNSFFFRNFGKVETQQPSEVNGWLLCLVICKGERGGIIMRFCRITSLEQRLHQEQLLPICRLC